MILSKQKILNSFRPWFHPAKIWTRLYIFISLTLEVTDPYVLYIWVFMLMRIYLWQRQTFQCWWQLWQCRAPIISETSETSWSPEDTWQHEGRGGVIISSHHGPLVIYFLQLGYLFYDHDLGWVENDDDGPLILMFSRGVFNVFCSIAHYKCFSFNREYLFT